MKKYYGGYQIADYQEFDNFFINNPSMDIVIKLNGTNLALNDNPIGSISITYETSLDFVIIVYDENGNVISNKQYQSTQIFFESLRPIQTLPFNLFGLISSLNMTETIFDDFISTFAIPISEYPDNAIEIYLLKSPRKQVTKSLKLVGIISGNYTKPITYRSISLDIVNHSDLPFFNYLYIPELKRYYYVQESTQIKEFAQLTLVEDVLMSWDSLIRSQTAFIKRNENTYNSNLYDDRYPDLVSKEYDITEYTNDLFYTNILSRYANTKNTSYPLMVVSGGAATYVVQEDSTRDSSSMELNYFPYEPLGQGNLTIYGIEPVTMNWYLTNGGMADITNIFRDVGEYIVSLRYYPFDVTRFMRTWLSSQDLYIGGKVCKDQSNNNIKATKMDRMGEPVPIAIIDIARRYYDFRDYAPYTKYTVYLPYLGFIDLDTNEIVGQTIRIRYAVDFIDGSVQAYIMLYSRSQGKDIRLIQVTDRKPISIEVPLNSTNSSDRLTHLLMGAFQIGGGAISSASGNPVGGVKSAKGAVGSFMSALRVRFNRGNIHGGLQSAYNPTSVFLIRESVEWASIVDIEKIYGKPLEEIKTLSALTGFTEIGEMNFNPNGEEIMDNEITEIENLLRTGVIL